MIARNSKQLFKRLARAAKHAKRDLKARYYGKIKSNYCGLFHCEKCISKTQKDLFDGFPKVNTCKCCSLKQIKWRLWKVFWKENQEQQSLFDNKKEVYKLICKRYEELSLGFKDFEEQHSHSVKKRNNQIEILKTEYARIKETTKNKTKENELLSKKEREQEDEIKELEKQKQTKKKELDDMNSQIEVFNRQNNESMEVQLNLKKRIREAIETIKFRGKMGRRRSMIENQMGVGGYGLCGGISFGKDEETKNGSRRKYSNDNPSCKCVIF